MIQELEENEIKQVSGGDEYVDYLKSNWSQPVNICLDCFHEQQAVMPQTENLALKIVRFFEIIAKCNNECHVGTICTSVGALVKGTGLIKYLVKFIK